MATVRYECPACSRLTGIRRGRGNNVARLAVHHYTGEAPSVWLRPGERCPGSLADVELLGVGPEDADDTLSVEQWFYFGRPGWDPHPRNRYVQYLEALHSTADMFTVAAGSFARATNGSFRFSATITIPR